MSSLIHELDLDGLMLMHVAGELPAEDAAEVAQLLSTDAGLRERLAAVGRDVAAGEAALAAADHVDPPAASPSASSVALRKVDRAVRQWHVDRAVGRQSTAPAGERQPRFPAWAYPAAAAAAVVVGTLSWWGFKADGPPSGGGSLATTTTTTTTTAEPPPDDADLARVPMLADATGGGSVGIGAPDLTDGERQARSLSGGDDDHAALPAIVRDGEAD